MSRAAPSLTLILFSLSAILSSAGLAESQNPSPQLEDLLKNLEILEANPDVAVGLVSSSTFSARPQWDWNSPEVQHFESRIRPVLIETCLKCHGGDKTSAGLRVDSRESLLAGGDSGPAIVPGDPDASLLIRALHYGEDGPSMPPKEKLPDAVVQDFVQWVAAGAPWPSAAPDATAAKDDAGRHWAFRPVVRSGPPEDSTGWAANEVDQFLHKAWSDQGLTPAAPADKRTLARRLYFDLIGLPPTPQEMEAYLADDSPDAYSSLVERLLASPHYGERWGRHWMDVIRYADTAGDSADYPVPELRRYRDYIIDSFNADTPYDQFITEQIAGDLLARENPDDRYAEKVIATGFIALSRRFGTTPYQTHHEVIEDTIDTMGQVFLGLTLKCARCHDHKFDPISTSDYYGLYGFFSSTQYPFAGAETSISKDQYREHFVPLAPRDAKMEKALADYTQQVEELRAVVKYLEEEDPLKDEVKKYSDQVQSLEKAIQLAEKTEDFDGEPLKGFLEEAKKKRNETRDAYRKKVQEKKTELKSLGFRGLPPDIEGAYAVWDKPTPADEAIQKRGVPSDRGDIVPRNAPAVLRLSDPLEPRPGTSGRLELAEWIAHPENPLTARVLVNRVWQHHFGRGIVPSSSNFGVMGEKPSHPELLDWLAAKFMESGWSIKHLHRLIVHSNAYRMSSEFDLGDAEKDPTNRFLWRYEPRRLDAESIRDSMLAASGLLNRSRGTEHPFPPMVEWRYTQHDPFQAIYPSNHRSVYLMTPRFQRHPYLGLFDGPDTNRSTGVRPESTVPLQALFFMNNEFVKETSEGFAERLISAAESDDDRLELAFRTALARLPSEVEKDRAKGHLEIYRARLAEEGAPDDAREKLALASLGRVLFAANEFIYLD